MRSSKNGTQISISLINFRDADILSMINSSRDAINSRLYKRLCAMPLFIMLYVLSVQFMRFCCAMITESGIIKKSSNHFTKSYLRRVINRYAFLVAPYIISLKQIPKYAIRQPAYPITVCYSQCGLIFRNSK